LTLIVGAALGYDVRQARANKQDRFLNAARAELQRASAGGTEAEVEQHLVAAHRSLDNAAKNGADEEEIAQWRAQVAAVEDRLGNVHRIDAMSQIGALPSSLDGTQPQLVLAAGQLYLVANGVYAIDEANLSMVQILDDGDKFGRITAGRIVNATVDGADLLVTDGKALFRRPPEGRWSAERLASSAHLDGWVGAACGVYQGSFYLLETDESPQIKKFSTDAFDREPENWLSQEATGVIASGIDMAVARSIFVLTSDGKIHQFHRGDPDAEIELERISSESQFVGLDQGPATGDIFLVEANGEAARLTRVDPDSAKAVHYEPVEFGPLGSAEAAAAFAQTTDFVVDEATGIIYFLSPDGLWRGNLT